MFSCLPLPLTVPGAPLGGMEYRAPPATPRPTVCILGISKTKSDSCITCVMTRIIQHTIINVYIVHNDVEWLLLNQ